MNVLLKENPVELRFSKAAASYDTAASVQDRTAQLLRDVIEESGTLLPPGPILELGCGTGLMTAHILELFPQRRLHITDLSPAMLQVCRQKMQSRAPASRSISFETLDADQLNVKNKFAAIICSFSLHWFKEPERVLVHTLEALVKGGYFFLAVPINGSFPEWKESCTITGAKFTRNPMPDANYFSSFAKDRGLNHNFKTQYVDSRYPSVLSFFQSLRNLGADLKLHQRGTSRDLLLVLKDLTRRNPDCFKASCEVCYGYVQSQV